MRTNSSLEFTPQQRDPCGEQFRLFDTECEWTFEVQQVPIEATLSG
jgi:hypothetical protein